MTTDLMTWRRGLSALMHATAGTLRSSRCSPQASENELTQSRCKKGVHGVVERAPIASRSSPSATFLLESAQALWTLLACMEIWANCAAAVLQVTQNCWRVNYWQWQMQWWAAPRRLCSSSRSPLQEVEVPMPLVQQVRSNSSNVMVT
jgi:hypothetical protein